MYCEFIFIIIILVVLYFLFLNDNRILVEADNGKKYYVVPEKNKKLLKEKANFLAKIDKNLTTLTKFMKYKQFPNKNSANLCYKRYNKLKLREAPYSETAAAYTLNKDEAVDLCIYDKKTGKMNNFNDAMFVACHELAHVMSITTGHGLEFQKNNKHIIKVALYLKIWINAKYEENNTNYCGTDITRSPCSDHDKSCNIKNLDTLFK